MAKPSSKDDSGNDLNFSEKAAILLNTLGDDAAAKIMHYLKDNDVRKLISLMGNAKKVPVQTLKQIMVDYYKLLSEESEILFGGGSKENLVKSLGEERARLIFGGVGVQTNQVKTLEALEMVDSRTLANFLVNEHPQTAALIIAHLPPDKKSDALKRLPDDMRAEVALRIANLDNISPELIQHVDEVLKTELANLGSAETTQVGGVGPVAEMFNLMDKSTEQSIMAKIEEKDPLLAEEIRKLMFVFEDLVKVDDKGLGLILKEVSNEQLLKALKNAPEAIKTKIFKNMSKRAAEQLQEDLQTLGPQRISEVEGAQQAMVAIARRLEEEGKIFIQRGGEADELI